MTNVQMKHVPGSSSPCIGLIELEFYAVIIDPVFVDATLLVNKRHTRRASPGRSRVTYCVHIAG